LVYFIGIEAFVIHHRRYSSGLRLARLGMITFVLLLAAAFRIIDLTRLPAGFSQEELIGLSAAQKLSTAAIASFYPLGEGESGYEGLYPTLEAISVGLVGTGSLPYRILSVWCGLVSVAILYRLGRRLFSGEVALIAALALAINLSAILISRQVVREALLMPFIMTVLWVISSTFYVARNIRPLPPYTVSYALLGGLIGLSWYVHWLGFTLILLVVAYLGYLVLSRQTISRRAVRYSLFTFAVMTIVGLPYLLSALRAPMASGASAYWWLRPTSPALFAEGLLQTIISLPVGLNGQPLSAGLITPLGFALFMIGLALAVQKTRSANVGLVLFTLLLGLLADAWVATAPNYSHSLIALPALMLLIGLGGEYVLQVLRRRVGRLTAPLVLASIVSVCLISGHLLFSVWAADPTVKAHFKGHLGYLAAYLDRQTDGLSTTICTLNLALDLPPAEAVEPRNLSQGVVATLQPAQADSAILAMLLHRRDLPLRFNHCLDALTLTQGGAAQRVAFAEPRASALVAAPITEWLQNAQPIAVAGLPEGSLFLVDSAQIVADSFGRVNLSYVEYAPESVGESDRAALPLRMGGYLTFEGYQLLPPPPYKAGDTFHVVTYWRADGRQVPGLRFFVHLFRNPYSTPIIQSDWISVEANRLQDRDVFIQILSLSLPEAFPADSYLLSIGAYGGANQQRLPAYDENVERGNRLFLDRIAVQ
jgi:4-amino-4-deoxy-L-arabinose transferase-like glycosyltransferase